MSVLIVGASVAGVRTAQALRAADYAGDITMIGEELHRPYDKPPLTKAMLDPHGDGAQVPLLSDDDLEALTIDLQLGVRALSLDPARRVVTTDLMQDLTYKNLVIATGVTPRTLPAMEHLSGVHAIRTADDAHNLRIQLPGAEHVVVIGAGFIGAEFATAASKYGCQVTIVEAQRTPMAHIVGEEVGALLADLHRANGVRLVTNACFARFEGNNHVSAVVLDDGRTLPADLVVVGIGTRPATDWLATSGLPVSNGIDCDEQLRVIAFPGVYAAGDVARRPHPHYDTSVRIEHWTSANEHGAVVAASIMRKPIPSPAMPYVWSDQYDHRIQIIGRPSAGKLFLHAGDAHDHLVALYAAPSGSLVGAVIVDDPRLMLRCRRAINERAQVGDLDLGLRITRIG